MLADSHEARQVDQHLDERRAGLVPKQPMSGLKGGTGFRNGFLTPPGTAQQERRSRRARMISASIEELPGVGERGHRARFVTRQRCRLSQPKQQLPALLVVGAHQRQRSLEVGQRLLGGIRSHGLLRSATRVVGTLPSVAASREMKGQLCQNSCVIVHTERLERMADEPVQPFSSKRCDLVVEALANLVVLEGVTSFVKLLDQGRSRRQLQTLLDVAARRPRRLREQRDVELPSDDGCHA